MVLKVEVDSVAKFFAVTTYLVGYDISLKKTM